MIRNPVKTGESFIGGDTLRFGAVALLEVVSLAAGAIGKATHSELLVNAGKLGGIAGVAAGYSLAYQKLEADDGIQHHLSANQ